MGSIWLLGKHRVGNGSATDQEFVNRVVGDRTAAACFVDSTYHIASDNFIGGNDHRWHRKSTRNSVERSADDYSALLRDSLAVLKECCRPGAYVFACTDWQHVMEMTGAGRACNMPLVQLVAWTKSDGQMNGLYRNCHELVCVFQVGNAALPGVERGRRRRTRGNVWNYHLPSLGQDSSEVANARPTLKPVAMVADALRDVTKRGEIVVDTFLKLGSTLIAAQQTGRICCGVELDSLSVDVAIRRWQNVTGRDAVLLETGQPFNEIARRRLNAISEPTDGE